MRWAAGKPRKLPSREEVVRLYVEENLPTTEIARMFSVSDPHTVRVQLLRAGIKLRRHTTSKRCKVKGCTNPPIKIRHTGNGCMYGALCADHRRQHYNELNRNRQRELKGIPPDKYRPDQIGRRNITIKGEQGKWLKIALEKAQEVRKFLGTSRKPR